MVTEFVLYELVTTVGSLFGIKLVNAKRQLRGINRPKQLPVIDKALRKKVGTMSATEVVISKNLIRFVNTIMRYRAVQYLIVLVMRKTRAEADKKIRVIGSCHSNTRGIYCPGRLLVGKPS
jgi:hypothetical protein